MMPPHRFTESDLAEVAPGVWRVTVHAAAGRAVFVGSAEQLLSELNGRQRAIFGNALEGRLISLGGLNISVREQ